MVVRAKQFLDDDDLIMHLAEAHEKIAVRGGGVNLVAEFAAARSWRSPAIPAWKRRSRPACPRC